MTSDTPEDMERVAPQKLLIDFARSHIAMCVLIAAALHVVVIGGSSLSYIYYTWINPAAAVAPEEAVAPAGGSGGTNEAAGMETAAAGGGTNEAAGTETAAARAAAERGRASAEEAGEYEPTEEQLNSPVMREITEVAAPEEIPRRPDDIGIDIQDTNPQ